MSTLGLLPFELHQLRCFDAVVRGGSFRAAAETLHLSQPAVSKHIARLEAQVGVQLLRRGARGSGLTAAGTELLPHLRAVLRAEENANQHISAVAGGRGGRVRIGAIHAAIVHIVPRAIELAAAAHATLDVEVTELPGNDVRAGVYDGTFDIGIPADARGVERPDLTTSVLTEGPLTVYARNDHPIVHGGPASREAIAAEPLLAPSPGFGLRDRVFDYLAGYDFRVVCEASNHETLRHLAAVGMGVTILPAFPFSRRETWIRSLGSTDLADPAPVTRMLLIHALDDTAPATQVMANALRQAATEVTSSDP